MNRKMRARRNNLAAREARESPRRVFIDHRGGAPRKGLEQGECLFITPDGSPIDSAPVLLNHDDKTFEILPEKKDMN